MWSDVFLYLSWKVKRLCKIGSLLDNSNNRKIKSDRKFRGYKIGVFKVKEEMFRGNWTRKKM